MRVVYRDQSWEFNKSMPVFRLLEELHVLPESVLVLRNGQLLTEDQRLNPEDDVKIVAVVSGG